MFESTVMMIRYLTTGLLQPAQTAAFVVDVHLLCAYELWRGFRTNLSCGGDQSTPREVQQPNHLVKNARRVVLYQE